MLNGQTLQERGFHCSQPHTQSSPSPKLKPSLSFWPPNTCLTVLRIPFLGLLFWILHNFALYEAFSQQDSHLGVQEVPSVHSQGFHTSARGRRQNPSPALAVGFSSLWAIAMELPHTPPPKTTHLLYSHSSFPISSLWVCSRLCSLWFVRICSTRPAL